MRKIHTIWYVIITLSKNSIIFYLLFLQEQIKGIIIIIPKN